ncbi:MAG: TolC family outer membrane protein [Gammaproteobacteria bacterium]|jgi:outer membrane protein
MRFIIPVIFAAAVAVPAHAANLYDTYKLARQQDSQYLSSEATLEANRENTPIARSALLPQVNVVGNADQIDSGSASDGTYQRNRIALNVTQAVFNRASWMNFKKAMHGVSAAEASFQAEEQFLIIRVAEAYFTVLARAEDLSFSRAESKAILKQLDQAQQRYDVGLIAITDVHEAQAAYDNARSREIAAGNALDDAREALIEIIGREPGKLAELKSRIGLNKPNPSNIEYWAGQALDNNPSVKAAMENVEAQSREVEVQRSGHFPTVDLVASAGKTDYNDAPITQFQDIETNSIGLELRIPLYSGGRTTSSTSQARHNLRAERFNLESAKREVARNVRNAYRGVITSITQVNALSSAMVSAQSALDATEAGYEVGTRTLVDVLIAQRNLFSARRDHALARYQYILNDLLLHQAAGILDEQDVKRINKLLK